MQEKEVQTVIDILKKTYPNASCALNFSTPYELLIATVLSAQCTDVRVNKVTNELFKLANTPSDMLNLGYDKVFDTIKSCGLGKSKTTHILQISQKLKDEYNSVVPCDINNLMSLSGVGRKTANVVMANAFHKDAIAVDTHVFRVTNRIGIVNEKDALKTEKALMNVLERSDWSFMHHVFILHGRTACKSQKPECDRCCIKEYCEYYKNK